MENCYWNKTGKHEALSKKLTNLLPVFGEVDDKKNNKKLEKFRKASNCYYDLYNNGLCNRANEFRIVFGIASTKYKASDYTKMTEKTLCGFVLELFQLVEAKMDEIILDAAVEQGLY